MKKWKILNKFKTKKKDSKEPEISVEENKELPKPVVKEKEETKEEIEELPEKEYRETLYSRGEAPKKPQITPKPIEKQWTGKRWENVEVIEKNIDDIGKRKPEHDEKTLTKLDLNKKVDRLISKRKK